MIPYLIDAVGSSVITNNTAYAKFRNELTNLIKNPKQSCHFGITNNEQGLRSKKLKMNVAL